MLYLGPWKGVRGRARSCTTVVALGTPQAPMTDDAMAALVGPFAAPDREQPRVVEVETFAQVGSLSAELEPSCRTGGSTTRSTSG